MLVTTQCASYCRYCTRTRIVGDPTQNFNRKDHEAQLDYLRRTPQVRDVLISGGDGLTLAPKLFESILRGIREIPHIEIIRIGIARARLPAPADRRRAVRDAREVPPALDQPPLQPPERDHARGQPRGRQADQGRPAGREPVGPPGRRQRLRPHPAGARPPARREPDPAVLPLPVRPRRGLRPLPDPGRQGPRDHGGPARPHLRLCGPDLRDRRARRRRQDPGHAELPDQLLGPQGRAAQLRGLHHDLRGAADLPAPRQADLRATASTSDPSPASRASWACSRASGCGSSRRASRRSTPRGNTEAHRLQDPVKWVPFGVGAIEGHGRRAADRSSRPATPRRQREPAYGPGEEPRPRDGEPTASAHGELL